MEVNSDILMELLKEKIKDSCTTEIANWIVKLIEESCNEAYERTEQGKAYHRIHSMCTLCSYAKYNPETHSYECRKDFENDCRIMYYDYDIRTSEEYPQGAFCECGVTIHLKDEELISGYNIIKCPKCGKEVGLFTSALKEIPSDLLVMSLLYLANEDSLKELIKENDIHDRQGKD